MGRLDGRPAREMTAPAKLDEPVSLLHLRDEVAVRLPRVDLPEILLEIAARTDFTAKFTGPCGARPAL